MLPLEPQDTVTKYARPILTVSSKSAVTAGMTNEFPDSSMVMSVWVDLLKSVTPLTANPLCVSMVISGVLPCGTENEPRIGVPSALTVTEEPVSLLVIRSTVCVFTLPAKVTASSMGARITPEYVLPPSSVTGWPLTVTVSTAYPSAGVNVSV